MIIKKILLIYYNYQQKSKEIVCKFLRFSSDFPKFINPLSVKLLFLYNLKLLIYLTYFSTNQNLKKLHLM